MSRGHIRQRGDVWYVVLSVPDPAKPGERKRPWIRTSARTRKEAEQECTRLLREVDTGSSLEPSKLTVGAYLDHWLDTEATNSVRASTLEGYRRQARLYIIPRLGAKKLQALRPTDITNFYAGLPTPSVCQNCRTVISGACKTAVKWGWLATNPVRDVTPPRYRPVRGDAWTGAESVAFLAAVADRRWWIAYRVVLATGLRQGELLDLRWGDIDLGMSELIVRRTAVWVGGQYASHPPKSGKDRVVSLDPDTVAALKRHHARQAEERLKAGELWRDEDRVIARADGGVVHRNTLSGAFRLDVRRAGARAIRFHDMRHTHATLLLEDGIPIKTVSTRLGHANITITVDTYQHVTGRMERDAADAIGRLLAG